MLTPQEASEKKFPKAFLGGYDMTDVDSFLDVLIKDYEQLYSESSVLKAKLKTLAEKVGEYRATEDVMRKTLLTAQKSAESVTLDAKNEADALLFNAQKESERILLSAKEESERIMQEAYKTASAVRSKADEYAQQVEQNSIINARNADKQFEETKADLKNFLNAVTSMYSEQLDKLSALNSQIDSPSYKDNLAESRVIPASVNTSKTNQIKTKETPLFDEDIIDRDISKEQEFDIRSTRRDLTNTDTPNFDTLFRDDE